nr:UDP-N-acetylglucosamine 2-epimerase (non-hydrolyzing) [Oceanicoccus sp. KOV_DT_Chl]
MKVLNVFGTRPEAIKMAPVVLGLQNDPNFFPLVCVTAQHREMLDQVLSIFDIKPDFDLNLMKPGQSLAEITSRVLHGVSDVIKETKPDIVLVHGDTTTCFAASLAAFYEGVKIGHVEAGLRTGNMQAPFPEEANRSLVGRLSNFNFAPTPAAVNNLLAENISESTITKTGNTVIDALKIATDKVKHLDEDLLEHQFGTDIINKVSDKSRKLILITGHRRENFGQGFIDLCNAIKELANNHPDWDFIYPVHLNPNVQTPVNKILNGLDNVILIKPLEYLPFVWIMSNADLILTDSGGVQEEGPSLGKPVLVMRDVTERPEAVEAGTVLLVGTNTKSITNGIENVLNDDTLYNKMATAINPYGDGKATPRIIQTLTDNFS